MGNTVDERIEAAMWAALAEVATRRAKETAHHLRKGETISCHLTVKGRMDEMHVWATLSGYLRTAQRTGRPRFEPKPNLRPR